MFSRNFQILILKIREFIQSTFKKIIKDNDFLFDQIVNMDEIPLFMNIHTLKTIAKIGSKEVNIKTHDQEKFMLLQY